MWFLLTIPLARFFEAWKDAIDFEYGSREMPLFWHALKWIVYPLWGISGYFFIFNFSIVTLVYLLFSLFIARLVFEFSLPRIRSIIMFYK